MFKDIVVRYIIIYAIVVTVCFLINRRENRKLLERYKDTQNELHYTKQQCAQLLQHCNE